MPYETSGSLITLSKSFANPQEPNFDNLVYSLNGGDIFLWVTGSPDSSSEETLVENLDGSSSYNLSWSSSHTEFRLEIELFSNSDDSQTPVFDEVDLVEQPPTVPQNLMSSVSGDDITLDWDAVSWNGDPVHYEILRGQSSGSYTQIATVNPGTTTYTDSGLEGGERYYYTVRAEGTGGTSGNSNETAETTDLLSASNVTLDPSVENEVTASWTNNDDSSDGSISVYRSLDGTLGQQIFSTTDLTTTSYTDTSVVDGEQYYYTVRRSTDHATSDSTQVSVISRHPAPTGLSASNITDDTADLSWTMNSDGAVSNRVYLEQTGDPSETTPSSMSFDGSTSWIDIDGAFDPTGEDEFTISVWAHNDGGNQGSNADIVHFGNIETILASNGSDNWMFFINDGSNHSLSPVSDTTGEWVHLVGVYDNGEMRLYVDGSLEGTLSSVGTPWDNDDTDAIGSSSGSSRFWSGSIADVRVYNRSLSDSEVLDVDGGDPPTNGLIAFWPLDLDRSGITPDLSTYANDGTVNGTTLTGSGLTDVSGDLPPDTTAYTTQNLLNGEQYSAYVHSETEHNEVRDQ